MNCGSNRSGSMPVKGPRSPAPIRPGGMDLSLSVTGTQSPLTLRPGVREVPVPETPSNYDVERLMYGLGLINYLVRWDRFLVWENTISNLRSNII